MAEVHVAAWRAAYRAVLSPSFLAAIDVAEWSERWRQRLSAGEADTAFLVATCDARVVGIAAAGPSRTPGEDRSGELRMLNVAPDWWSRGVGGALHASCLDHLVRVARRRAHLWVAVDNRRARDFYARRQWVLTADHRLDRRMEPPLSEVRYALNLDTLRRRATPI